MKKVTVTVDVDKFDVSVEELSGHMEAIMILQTAINIIQQDIAKKSNLIISPGKPNLKVVS